MKIKLKREFAGSYTAIVKNEVIEIWKSEGGFWFISSSPDAYFETLKGVRDFLTIEQANFKIASLTENKNILLEKYAPSRAAKEFSENNKGVIK